MTLYNLAPPVSPGPPSCPALPLALPLRPSDHLLGPLVSRWALSCPGAFAHAHPGTPERAFLMLVTWATPAPPSDCNRNFTVSGLLLFFSSIQIRFPGGLFLFVCFCFLCGHVSFPPAQSVPGFLLAREVLFGFVLIGASLLDCELDRNLVCSAHGHVPIAAAVPDAEAARDGFSRRSEDFAGCPQEARGGRKELLHNSRALFESLISSHLVTCKPRFLLL